MLIAEIIAAALCGPLDRVRGHHKHILNHRALDKLAYGAALTLALGFHRDPLLFVICAALLALGMAPGWGEPMGAILDKRQMRPDFLEWWQIGPARRSPWVAVALRGLLWGAPLIPLALYSRDWSLLAVSPVMAVAFVTGMHIGPRLPYIEPDDAWGRCEWARGWVAGAMLVGVGWALPV